MFVNSVRNKFTVHFIVRFSKWLTEFWSRCNNVIYIFVKARLMEKEEFLLLWRDHVLL
jgi:hypothetical protein